MTAPGPAISRRTDPSIEPSLWRNGAFVRVFSASTISYFGTFITRTALPLAAIFTLGAGALEISAIRSVEFVAWLLVGLVAGAWVDRLRRRPIMIGADLGRALLLGSIPVAAIAGVLGLPQLLIVAFLAAVLSPFFNSASTAYLPTVVERHRLLEANSALSAANSVSEFTGFSASGFLVQVFTAPIAIGVDAISFVVSAILLATIRRPEPPRPAVSEREPILHEIREGLGVVRRSPVLRAMALAHAANHVLWGIFSTTYILYAVQDLGLGPAAIGLISGLGGVGAFVGATAARRVVARLGAGRSMIVGLVGLTIGSALIPLAPSGAVFVAAAMLVVQQLLGDSTGILYDIVETSLTQSIVEGRVLGRVDATVGTFTTVTALVGAILGGFLAEAFGLRATVAIGVIAGATAILFIWFSPVRTIRDVPTALATHVPTLDETPLTE
jgi:MFS family permease